MTALTIKLDNTTIQALEQLANHSKVTVSEWVRNLVQARNPMPTELNDARMDTSDSLMQRLEAWRRELNDEDLSGVFDDVRQHDQGRAFSW